MPEQSSSPLTNQKQTMTLYETVLEYDTDAKVWIAYHPALPGCISDGRTKDEALINLEDARREYVWSLREDGLSIPPAKVAEYPGGITYWYDWSDLKPEPPTKWDLFWIRLRQLGWRIGLG